MSDFETSLIEKLVIFLKNTSIENLTGITIASKLLRKYRIEKKFFKKIFTKSINLVEHMVDKRKRIKLLKINMKVLIYLCYRYLFIFSDDDKFKELEQ